MTVTAEPPTAARGRSRIFSLAKFVVSAFLLAFIISKAGGHALAHTLLHARPGWLAVGLVLTAGAVGASAAQWQVLLAASDMPRRFRRLLSLEIACKAFDAALPSSIGGDVARTLLVADTPQERLRATRITLLRAVGIHPPIAYAAVVVLVVNALSMLPISLGGYGLREGTFSLFLAVGGIATAAQGAAVGLCITVQTLLMGLLGIPIYLLLGRQRHALREKQLIAEPT